jgi:hypothetical protein
LKGEHAWLEQGIVDESYYHDAPKTEDRGPKTENASV